MADYELIELYEYPKVHRGMYLHAPIVLMYQEKGSTERRPAGIRFNVPKKLADEKWEE